MSDPRLQLLEATLGAQYEFLRLLGQGGAGTVYLARERLLERLVAVKVLRPELITPESRERFIREARTAAKLMHANVVPLYAFGQAGDTLFYIMGYVEGESLETLLERAGRLDSVEARRILMEVADALDYAHRNQVIHRDVKPDNVLIERGSRRALLTDFGIAKTQAAQGGPGSQGTQGLTQTGHIVGTPLYMSPEQAAGDTAIDGRSDVYSLGVIGYRMLAGRLPIEGSSPQDVMRRHVMQQPAPLSELAGDAPADLSWAIMRCLDKDPMRRWPTAEAFRQTLESGDESLSDLPEPLEHLHGRAVTALRLALALGVTGAVAWGLQGTPALLALVAALVISMTAMLAPPFRQARQLGLDARRTWRLLGAPPERWAGWWPSALRRNGDVWFRLPADVRRHRIVRTATLATAALLAPPIVAAAVAGFTRAPAMLLPSASALAVLVLLATAAVSASRASAARGLRAQGVPVAALRKWLLEPTWNSRFWRRSEVAALLAKVTPPERKVPLDTPPGESYSIITPTQFELPRGMFDHIDPRSPTPLYAQIASRLRVAIASGELRSGDGLPSVRQLAGQLRVNPATVVQAYRELEVEGLVNTRQGAGTFVQDVAPDRRHRERDQEARRLIRELLSQAASFGITTAELLSAMEREVGTTVGAGGGADRGRKGGRDSGRDGGGEGGRKGDGDGDGGASNGGGEGR